MMDGDYMGHRALWRRQWTVRGRALRLGMAPAVALLLVGIFAAHVTTVKAQAQTSGPAYWMTYQGDVGRSGFNANETNITTATAPNLTQHWSLQAPNSISAQTVTYNNTLYWGAWDGYERATSLTGQAQWATFLGQTTDANCVPPTAGVASTPAIARVPFWSGRNFLMRTLLFVGGGDGQLYALDASSGAVIWTTRLGPSPATFLWSSPLVSNGSVYIGVSSFGDCPLVQGQLVKLNARTGQVQATFNTVPNGCTGGGVWGSPTLDTATNELYFATGNPGSCGSPTPYAEAVVAVNAQSLALIASWQVPASQQGVDTDFGSTPTLFTATINSVTHHMLGIINKIGYYYALDRDGTALANGPLWEQMVGYIGSSGDCPQCGSADISPAAWDGATLYVGSGDTTINATPCNGSIRALNPATGAILWQQCLDDHVLAPVTASPGVVYLTEGTHLLALNATTGAILYTFTDSTSGSLFYGGPIVAGGVVYAGNMDGAFYAFGL